MVIFPQRTDYWRFPIYRWMIPALMKDPAGELSYDSAAKNWHFNNRVVVVRGKVMGIFPELLIRVFREIGFIFSSNYKKRFFAAKEKLERVYQNALNKQRDDKWQEEIDKEKFLLREEQAQKLENRVRAVRKYAQNDIIWEKKRHELKKNYMTQNAELIKVKLNLLVRVRERPLDHQERVLFRQLFLIEPMQLDPLVIERLNNFNLTILGQIEKGIKRESKAHQETMRYLNEQKLRLDKQQENLSNTLKVMQESPLRPVGKMIKKPLNIRALKL